MHSVFFFGIESDMADAKLLRAMHATEPKLAFHIEFLSGF